MGKRCTVSSQALFNGFAAQLQEGLLQHRRSAEKFGQAIADSDVRHERHQGICSTTSALGLRATRRSW